MLKNKQWICNLIALIILISGMCTIEVKADSVFLYPQTAVVTCLEVADEVISSVDVQVTEILCTRNTASSCQIVAQITNSRKVIKLSMVFLCVAVFSLLLSNFYTTERVVAFPRLGARTVVLNYIHNTDGKK